MLHGIRRDPSPYNQVVFGSTTMTSQALNTARHLRTQSQQLATAAVVVEECYQSLIRLQSTAQGFAEAEPSDEYAKAITRHRHWLQRYNEFLTRSRGDVWAFVGPTMPRFRVLNPKTIVPRASIIAGQTLFPKEGASYYLNMAPYRNDVEGQPVYTYT